MRPDADMEGGDRMNWFELTSLLTRPIAFHRIFATIGGGACCGLFLSQAFYWTSRTKDPDGWFYKSQVEWEEETALTRYEQENVRRELKSRGLIEEKKEGIPCRLFYRINKDSLLQALGGYFKPLSVEEILSSCKSTLNQLSQMGVMRAKKLGIEHEYVDYALILKTHGNTCHICNKPITQGVGQSGGALAFDHVIPVSKRGSHTFSNIKPSHASCNISKSNNLSDPCCEQFVVPQQTSLLPDNELACCATTSQAVVAQQTYLYTETTSEITHTKCDEPEKLNLEKGRCSSTSSDFYSVKTEPSNEIQTTALDQSSPALVRSRDLKQLESLKWQQSQIPGKDSEGGWRQEMVEALWDSSRDFYSYPKDSPLASEPNERHIKKTLSAFESKARSGDKKALLELQDLEVIANRLAAKKQEQSERRAVVEKQQFERVRDHSDYPRSFHEKWVKEYITSGHEVLAQKYEWLDSWLEYLELSHKDLFKQIQGVKTYAA